MKTGPGWTRWIEPLTSVSVIISLIVLIAEVRTNTRAIERQNRLDYVTSLTEPFLDDVPIGAVLAKIKAVDGREAPIEAFIEAYGLTDVEAAAWGRYLYRLWYGIEADFYYSGREAVESTARTLLLYPDAKLYWKTNRGYHSAEFGAFIDGLTSEIEPG